ncbi:MAG: hypothetical protein F6K31_13205 [Symploca sp. SIO2G7]|nr:hypothetical protein [Symploca sp. SIO2G7]
MARPTIESMKKAYAHEGYTIEKGKGKYLVRKERDNTVIAEPSTLEEARSWLNKEKSDSQKAQNNAEKNVSKIMRQALEGYFLPDTTVDDQQVEEWSKMEYVAIADICQYFKFNDQISDPDLAKELAIRGISVYFLEERSYVVIGTSKASEWEALEVV